MYFYVVVYSKKKKRKKMSRIEKSGPLFKAKAVDFTCF